MFVQALRFTWSETWKQLSIHPAGACVSDKPGPARTLCLRHSGGDVSRPFDSKTRPRLYAYFVCGKKKNPRKALGTVLVHRTIRFNVPMLLCVYVLFSKTAS